MQIKLGNFSTITYVIFWNITKNLCSDTSHIPKAVDEFEKTTNKLLEIAILLKTIHIANHNIKKQFTDCEVYIGTLSTFLSAIQQKGPDGYNREHIINLYNDKRKFKIFSNCFSYYTVSNMFSKMCSSLSNSKRVFYELLVNDEWLEHAKRHSTSSKTLLNIIYSTFETLEDVEPGLESFLIFIECLHAFVFSTESSKALKKIESSDQIT
ncbi:hypothetical protein COBT_000021 [Conglomerata obtusa]